MYKIIKIKMITITKKLLVNVATVYELASVSIYTKCDTFSVNSIQKL